MTWYEATFKYYRFENVKDRLKLGLVATTCRDISLPDPLTGMSLNLHSSNEPTDLDIHYVCIPNNSSYLQACQYQ